MTLEQFVTAFFVVAVIVSLLLVPYTVFALRLAEGTDRMKQARTDSSDPYHLALDEKRLSTTVNLFGMLILVANFCIRIYAQIEPAVEAGPNWSYLLTMVSTSGLLVVLWFPAVRLMHLKYRIMGWRLIPANVPWERRRR